MNIIKEYERNGKRVRIIKDEDPITPEEFGGSVYLAHIHHSFRHVSDDLPFSCEGSMEEFLNPPFREDYVNDLGNPDDEELEDYLDAKAEWDEQNQEWAIFIVDSHTYSGISLSMRDSKSTDNFPDRRWNTSRCGCIMIKKADFPDSSDRGYSYVFSGVKKFVPWLEVAEGHLKKWNLYLSSDVFGFIVDIANECKCCGNVKYVEMDSCWGFYGINLCEEEANRSADYFFEEENGGKSKS